MSAIISDFDTVLANLAAAIRQRGNLWRRWCPYVKIGGYCEDVTVGAWT